MTSLYDHWLLERWQTSVSDVKSLFLVSLIDTKGILSLVFEDRGLPQQRRFRVEFTRYPGYRNLVEEYRLELWQLLGNSRTLGRTLQVAASPWIDELKQHEPLLNVVFPNLKHFLITTEDDVIEVLSDETPVFREIGTTADDPPTGQTIH